MLAEHNNWSAASVTITGALCHRQGVHVVVRIRVPSGGRAARRVQRGNVIARRPTDASELATGVDRATVRRQRFDEAIGVRVPSGGRPAGADRWRPE